VPGRDVLVLCYHAVSPRWEAELSVSPEDLHRQVAYLLRAGWKPTTFTDAVTGTGSGRVLAVTFDDAFASVKRNAEPILRRLGAVATVFAPTSFMAEGGRLQWPGIDQWVDGEWAPELEAMSWDDLRRLKAAGWEIGSHTCHHPRLPTLDDAGLQRELVQSRHRVTEELGECRSLAFPYGEFDARVLAHAAEAGYDAAARLTGHLGLAGPHAYPRTGIYHIDTWPRFRLKVSRPMRMLRASSLWPDVVRV
jgi:peptidoglycan/xylan/chitin deacetylase (PgdA/CDA1 family)